MACGIVNLKFAKAMQHFAGYGVDFSCNLLNQKLRALAQQEAPRGFIGSLVAEVSVCVLGRAGH